MHSSLVYMLISALGFALMAACVKAVSAYAIPLLEIVAARAAISLLISYLDVKRKGISVWGNERGLLFARGLVGSLALVCVYYAVSTLPLAEASVLQFTYPAFTALLALIFLREAIQLRTLLCLGFSFFGLLVMLQPQWQESGLGGGMDALPLFSLVAALAGAFGSAVAYVLVRRLSQTEDSSVIIFYFPLVALPGSLLFLGQDFVMPSLPALLLLLGVGIFTQIGQVGLTKAMALEGAAKVSAYAYVQVVFAALLGWFFFQEIPSLWTLLGGVLILFGALANSWPQRRSC